MTRNIRKTSEPSALLGGPRFTTKVVRDIKTGKQARDAGGDFLVEDILWTAEECAAADSIHVDELPLEVASAIKSEAERRITAGTLINGVQFRCNEPSVNRIHGMLTVAREAEAAGLPFSQTFMTEAGITVTVASAAEVLPIFKAASGHVSAVLTASATLQAQIAAMTTAQLEAFNASDPVHWP